MGLIDNIKEVVTLVQRIGNIELLEKVLHLEAEVLKLTGESIKKEETINEKEKEIIRLKDSLKFKKVLIRKHDYYYEKDKDGKIFGDPYCSYCWEYHHIPIHVYKVRRNAARWIVICPNCKNEYYRMLPIEKIQNMEWSQKFPTPLLENI